MIRSILAYAAETRLETQITERKLRVTKMKVLRNIIRITFTDKKKKSDIRARCGVKDVTKWTQERMKHWNEHV